MQMAYPMVPADVAEKNGNSKIYGRSTGRHREKCIVAEQIFIDEKSLGNSRQHIRPWLPIQATWNKK